MFQKLHVKMALADGVNSSNQHADHQESSDDDDELEQERPPDNINRRLYNINFFLEKIVAVMFANHHSAFALLAVVTYCCIHVI